MAYADDLESSMDEWVNAHLASSPAWGTEKWEALGKILDVEFSFPGEQSRIYTFTRPNTPAENEAA